MCLFLHACVYLLLSSLKEKEFSLLSFFLGTSVYMCMHIWMNKKHSSHVSLDL